MNQILEPGQSVRAEASGMDCTVGRFLGAGGQGEVYRGELGGKPIAVKWFFPHIATGELRSSIETLTKTGPPNERFLWPLDMLSAPCVAGFRYVMPLRAPRVHRIL